MESRKFVCVVDGIPATGTVYGDYKEIMDYKVQLQIGEEASRMNFEFTMIMVSTPPLYVVNRVTTLIGFSQLHTPVESVRQSAEVCFESTLRFIASTYGASLRRAEEVAASEAGLLQLEIIPTNVPEALKLALGINQTYQA